MRATYDSSFKTLVLSCYKQEGPKEASLRYGVAQSIIQKWRRDAGIERFVVKKFTEGSQREKKRRRQYDLNFKVSVLEHFSLNGEAETCAKFQINPNLIYKWRQKQQSGSLDASHPFHENDKVVKSHEDIVKENEILSFQKCSDEKKKEVVRYMHLHGREATLEKYKISNPTRLSNWSRKFRADFKGFSRRRRSRKVDREPITAVFVTQSSSSLSQQTKHETAELEADADTLSPDLNHKLLNTFEPVTPVFVTESQTQYMEEEKEDDITEIREGGESEEYYDEYQDPDENLNQDHDENLNQESSFSLSQQTKLETADIDGDSGDPDLNYKPLNIFDMIHVDQQLLNQSHNYKGDQDNFDPVVKIEVDLDMKTEADEEDG